MKSIRDLDMTKISILLPTKRSNESVFKRIKQIQDGLKKYPQKRRIFTDEFIPLMEFRIEDAEHHLDVTLQSIASQTFKDYELIISHRYPEDALDVVKKYDIPVKLVREKHSIWHDLGDKYATLNSSINTGFIHSSGELLWRLDDLTFFNNQVLQELWDAWKAGYYITSRGFRCIEFDESITNQGPKVTKLGELKHVIEHLRWRGQHKPLTKGPDHSLIPPMMCWGMSSTISRDEFMKIGGQDEIYDGCVCGTDIDLGNRLTQITKHKRVVSKNYIYEIDDIPYKYNMRDDNVLRAICGQAPNPRYIQANTWKPEYAQLRRYEKWHKQNIGELDEHWNELMSVPPINLEKEYEKKELGEVLYSNYGSKT